MAKPSDDLSDENLHRGLVTGEFQGRDALIAEEMLKRRHEGRTRDGRYKIRVVRSCCRCAVALDETKITKTCVVKRRQAAGNSGKRH